MIWISQWLCPRRHCSIALVWDDQHETRENVEATGERFYREGTVNRWCGLCGGALHIEHGQTRFKTLEEAQPHLEALQLDNLASRALLERLQGEGRN